MQYTQAENCKNYNSNKSSEYHQVAEKFERYVLSLFGSEESKGAAGKGGGEAAS